MSSMTHNERAAFVRGVVQAVTALQFEDHATSLTEVCRRLQITAAELLQLRNEELVLQTEEQQLYGEATRKKS